MSDTGEGGIGPSNVIERDVLFHFISGEIYTGHILVGAAEVPRAVVQHRFKFQFQLERAGRNHACDSKKKQERGGSTRSSARARAVIKGGGGSCLPKVDAAVLLASNDVRSRGKTLNRPLSSVVLGALGTRLEME